MPYSIEVIENLHWRFPKKKRHIRLKNMSDSELQSIRNVVRKHPNKTVWFAVPSEEWFENITYYLKYRKIDKKVGDELICKKIDSLSTT